MRARAWTGEASLAAAIENLHLAEMHAITFSATEHLVSDQGEIVNEPILGHIFDADIEIRWRVDDGHTTVVAIGTVDALEAMPASPIPDLELTEGAAAAQLLIGRATDDPAEAWHEAAHLSRLDYRVSSLAPTAGDAIRVSTRTLLEHGAPAFEKMVRLELVGDAHD